MKWVDHGGLVKTFRPTDGVQGGGLAPHTPTGRDDNYGRDDSADTESLVDGDDGKEDDEKESPLFPSSHHP